MLVQKAKGGLSLLHLAAGAGKPDTVGWLLDKKVAVNDASNDEKLTPLHCSVLGGRLCQATVDKLIRNGASCGARFVHPGMYWLFNTAAPLIALPFVPWKSENETRNSNTEANTDEMTGIILLLLTSGIMFQPAFVQCSSVW